VEFSGKNEHERGVIIDVDYDLAKQFGLDTDLLKFGQTLIKIDPKYYRPTEVDLLIGDNTKAREQLNWQPKYDLKGIVKEMVLSDLNLVKKDQYLKKGGFKIYNYFE
jgi:GDPmannose 4,6-dehydratase